MFEITHAMVAAIARAIPSSSIMNMMKKKPAVLYHYPCPDGAFAALAAHLYFSSSSVPALFFPNTVYKPISPNNLPLHEIDDLYLLDYVGPSGFVQQVSSKVSKVVILDHHKTALEAPIEGENVSKTIDMERSGATIAYDYFKNKFLDNGLQLHREFERLSLLFDYIEDGDLWRWRLENSKAFSSGLKDLNIEFSFQLNPRLFEQLLSLDLESVISQGIVSLSHKQRLIEETLAHSYEIVLGGGAFGHCLAVDADAVAELRSELGHQLATKSHDLNLRGIGAVVYRVPELQNDQLVKISLRSVDSEDTTAIAQEFGGGGHRNASSFMLSSAEFERWKTALQAA
ncbi:hypothetical protein KPL71_008208 [Citrus sinensis]|uniref:Uncharacterized protein n=1 Tax=Citrus sinensis TaxID=2711 RepID=A0ACB8M4W5_CITSI|nr:hypothetical protein KPL71_008208 [Citrus sinensis]